MADEQEETPVAPPQPVLHTENVSSFLDLQTEFIKRRDAAIAGKSQSFATEPTHRRTPRNNILAISKEEKKAKSEVSTLRAQRIRQNEEAIRKEEQQRAKQHQILQQKAAIYERMAKGERLVYDDGKEAEFLVDFHTKKKELEEEARNKPSTSSETNGESRGEGAMFTLESPLVVHYDYSEDKGRVFGASHVPLPTMDEEAREQKIKELIAMTEETHRKRAERKRQRNEEEAEERRRLNRVRARMGLEPIPSSEDEEEEEQKGAAETTESDVSAIPLPPSSPEAKTTKEPEQKKQRFGVREWDRGKIGCMRWAEEQRDEREDEFAPPSFYYGEENDGRGKKKRKN
ncbi:hypothetical protein niasHS_010839 [Heterodera schachtii]|uniref:Uncharacterized protein n=1 Tax=Heterodera schachtii TaxID=97005 RepID=A0ABD2IV93_HETSC